MYIENQREYERVSYGEKNVNFTPFRWVLKLSGRRTCKLLEEKCIQDLDVFLTRKKKEYVMLVSMTRLQCKSSEQDPINKVKRLATHRDAFM